MSERAKIVVSTQLVPVSDLAVSEAFYTDVLGFKTVIRSPEHGYVAMRREGFMIGLQGNFGPEEVKITGEMMAAQIWVEGLDTLWREYEDKLTALPPGRVRPPFKQDYGVREFHVKDPDGFLMLFSEAADATLN